MANPDRPALESDLESWFRGAVRRAGGYTFKMTSGTRGVPDRLVVMPGGTVYLVELKRASDGQLSPVQVVWHNRIRELGGRVIVLATKADAAAWLLDPDNNRPPWPLKG